MNDYSNHPKRIQIPKFNVARLEAIALCLTRKTLDEATYTHYQKQQYIAKGDSKYA